MNVKYFRADGTLAFESVNGAVPRRGERLDLIDPRGGGTATGLVVDRVEWVVDRIQGSTAYVYLGLP